MGSAAPLLGLSEALIRPAGAGPDPALPRHVRDYVDQHLEAADRLFLRYGVPAPVALAAGGLETGWGDSDLARYAHNHHGMKALRDWRGPLYLYEHDEVEKDGRPVRRQSYFRYYDSDVEGFLDYGRFLRGHRRYHALFRFAATDYGGWCFGLDQCGYATDPYYGQKLLRIIDKYRLDRLDGERPALRAEVRV
jgi:flagellum-specific peptidoglycan hydrolase FlgJ